MITERQNNASSSDEPRRDVILDAADRLLARYGYTKMTVDDLAKEAGIGKGTVYLHFKSKKDVVLSHVDRIVRRLIERLQVIAKSNRPAAVKLRQMLVLRVMFRFDSVQHYTESITEVLRNLRPQLLRNRREHFAEEATVLVKVLRDGKRRGEFHQHHAASMARVLISATNGLLPFSLSTTELGKREDVEELVTKTADLLVSALALPSAPKRKSG